MSDSFNDNLNDDTIYCRLLGHEVPFSYCRRPGSDVFCKNITGCWEGRIDIHSFLAANYTSEQIAQAFKPKAPKIVSLLDLIQKAKENRE